jgi:hypothetical protein
VATRFEGAVLRIGDGDDRRATSDLAHAAERRRAAAFEKIDVDEDGVGRVGDDIVAVDVVGRRHDVNAART